MTARPLLVAVAGLIALLELAGFVTSVATFSRPVAEYGYNIGYDGRTVLAVEPGLAAARAGLRPSDVIDYAKLSIPGRINALINELVEPGTRNDVAFSRNGAAHVVTLFPVKLPWLYSLVNLSYAVAGLALGAVSLGLLVLRPNRMTWGFALVVPPLLLPEPLTQWAQTAPAAIGFGYEVIVGILYALQAAGLLIFASRFPANDPQGINRTIDRIAVPIGAAFAVVYAYVDWSIWFSPYPPYASALIVQDYVAPVLPNLAALFALGATYLRSDQHMRSRLAPTLIAFVLLIIGASAAEFGSVLTSSPTILLFLYFTFSFAAVLVAVAVAYAVIHHRVIDVSFIVGRTLVYSILTIFAVSMFTLIEFFVGKLLEDNGLATVLEIVAALALGLSLNALHGRLDQFIDRVLFRRRHLAETRIEHTARTLPHATSTGIVADMIVEEPADAFDLASAAVFVLSDDERLYRRERAEGWSTGDATELELDDHLVVRMRAELHAVHLEDLRWPRADLPTGNGHPLYAVPVAVGNRLEAIAIYGAHSGGEDLDPDERRSLRTLGRGAALAYDHLRAVALRASLDKVRGENAALRRVEHTLTALLEKRLQDQPEATTE